MIIIAIVATTLIAGSIGIAIGKAMKDTGMASEIDRLNFQLHDSTERRYKDLQVIADQGTVISLLTVENDQLMDKASRSLPAVPIRSV